jgi:hypothetical protein
MAFATYSDLVAAIRDHLVGHSLTDAAIADFIGLAETDFNREIRVRQMLKRSVATVAAQYVTLPGDFLQAHNITLSSGASPRPLRAISMDDADIDRAQRRGGTPAFFVVSGDQLELVPTPSEPATVELVYYARIPALGPSQASNWLLAQSPDLYLYSALGHAASYVVDPERQQVWRAEAIRIRAAMDVEHRRSRRTGPILQRSRMFAGADRRRNHR